MAGRGSGEDARMELIYVFMGNVDRPLQNQGVNLGNRFRVDYDAESRTLHIRERQGAEGEALYGEHIRSLDLLVGKNGTGKSTMLRLLGLPQRSRVHMLPPMKDQQLAEKTELNTWFALYHIRDDWFAADGYWADMFSFVPPALNFQPWYSMAFRYDARRQCALGDVRFLQDAPALADERRVTESLFYVFYEPEIRGTWYSQSYETPQRDPPGDVFCQRIYAEHVGLEGIERYLYDSVHNGEFEKKLGTRPGSSVTLRVRQGNKSVFAREGPENSYERERLGAEAAGRLLYGEGGTLVDPSNPIPIFSRGEREIFTRREKMVLVYLEELICGYLGENEHFGERQPARFFRDRDHYETRKQYLLDFLKELSSHDELLARDAAAGIEAIPEAFFRSGSEAVIRVRDMEENFLVSLAEALDWNLEDDHDINHRYYLRMGFEGISEGEAQYLDLYATLYTAVQDRYRRRGDTCVLLLDEPDCRFHPEWSRTFIQNLTELLGTEGFRDYRYQILISTHSPFLVSDVPGRSVHCLRLKDGRVTIEDSPHGFLCSLNDLITDSFYADSIFGAFAENYANALIRDIQEAETLQKQSPDQARELVPALRKRAGVIEDELICRSLMRRIRRLEGEY